MIESHLIDQIILLLINLAGIWLGFWVLLASPKRKVNQLFFLITSFSLLWINFSYLSNFAQDIHQALLFTRLVFGSIPLFFISAYFFSVYFPTEAGFKKSLILNRLVLIVSIIFCSTSIATNWVIKRVEFRDWGTDFSTGIMGNIFYLSIFTLTFLIIGQLFYKYFRLSRQEKLKIQYLLVGASVFALMNLIFNVALPLYRNSHQFYQFGNYSIVFLLGFTAYAIVKRKLFEIKVVLTQLLVGFIAILLLVNVVGSESAFEYIWKGSLFVAFLVTGALLIKSVLNETKRREQLEKVTAQLRGANVKLRELDQAKTEFLAIASHQLRTPLTAIRGYLSMLRRGDYGQVPTDFVDPLREVYQSTLRLAKLTSRLLDATRIETGRLKMNFGPVSLEGLISSVVDELKSQAKEKSLYLRFLKSKEKLPSLSLDLEKIRQVLLNIIDNGLKYTQKGGVEISFRLTGVDKVRIKVQDTGEGITKEELEKIFQSFSRGLAGEKFHTAGAGLGLYIAKEFVELHQGKIWATSPGTGKGTAIWIELPLKSNQAKTEKDLTSFSGGKKKKLPR